MNVAGSQFQLLNIGVFPGPAVLFGAMEVDALVIHRHGADAALAQVVVADREFDLLGGAMPGLRMSSRHRPGCRAPRQIKISLHIIQDTDNMQG